MDTSKHLAQLAADDATVVAWLGLLALVLALVALGLGAALYATRQELKRDHALCMHAWSALETEQKLVKRGQEERDQLVLTMNRLLTRITELQEAVRILGGVASDQLDRMRDEASGFGMLDSEGRSTETKGTA